MKPILTLILFVCAAQAKDYYVAPGGSPQGNGLPSSPWDLATGLEQSGLLKPGDTLWIRGGTYTGAYTCTLLGSPSAPIIVRNYQNERAIIDGTLVGHIPAGAQILSA